jgi:hypothetical protein
VAGALVKPDVSMLFLLVCLLLRSFGLEKEGVAIVDVCIAVAFARAGAVWLCS